MSVAHHHLLLPHSLSTLGSSTAAASFRLCSEKIRDHVI